MKHLIFAIITITMIAGTVNARSYDPCEGLPGHYLSKDRGGGFVADGASVGDAVFIEKGGVVCGGVLQDYVMVKAGATVNAGKITGYVVIGGQSIINGGQISERARVDGMAVIKKGFIKGHATVYGGIVDGGIIKDNAKMWSGTLEEGTTLTGWYEYYGQVPLGPRVYYAESDEITSAYNNLRNITIDAMAIIPKPKGKVQITLIDMRHPKENRCKVTITAQQKKKTFDFGKDMQFSIDESATVYGMKDGKMGTFATMQNGEMIFFDDFDEAKKENPDEIGVYSKVVIRQERNGKKVRAQIIFHSPSIEDDGDLLEKASEVKVRLQKLHEACQQ